MVAISFRSSREWRSFGTRSTACFGTWAPEARKIVIRGPAWAEWRSSLARLAILVGQHVAAADMIGRAHQPLLLHPLDQAGGAVISDAQLPLQPARRGLLAFGDDLARSEEHTSELQSLMRISYAVFCLKK